MSNEFNPSVMPNNVESYYDWILNFSVNYLEGTPHH